MHPQNPFVSRPGQDHENRKTVFQPVKPGQPDQPFFFRPKRVFLSGLFLFVVFPFIIPGRRNHASVFCPGFPECFLFRSGFCPRVDQQSLRSAESPFHGEHAPFAAPAGRDRRQNSRRKNLPFCMKGLLPVFAKHFRQFAAVHLPDHLPKLGISGSHIYSSAHMSSF